MPYSCCLQRFGGPCLVLRLLPLRHGFAILAPSLFVYQVSKLGMLLSDGLRCWQHRVCCFCYACAVAGCCRWKRWQVSCWYCPVCLRQADCFGKIKHAGCTFLRLVFIYQLARCLMHISFLREVFVGRRRGAFLSIICKRDGLLGFLTRLAAWQCAKCRLDRWALVRRRSSWKWTSWPSVCQSFSSKQVFMKSLICFSHVHALKLNLSIDCCHSFCFSSCRRHFA